MIDEFNVIYKVSIQKICKLFKFTRSTYYYKAIIDHQAVVIKQRIKDIAAVRVSYGYRRIHIMLIREGIIINRKRLYRLYSELNLQLRNKRPKRRVQALRRKETAIATAGNEHWSMDFMSGQLFYGRKNKAANNS